MVASDLLKYVRTILVLRASERDVTQFSYCKKYDAVATHSDSCNETHGTAFTVS